MSEQIEFAPPAYSQRVQELVDAINAVLYKMDTRDWPTLTYKISGTGSRAVKLAVVHIALRHGSDGTYYVALLSNRSRTMRSGNAIMLTQHDLDFIAKQVGLTPTDYENI